MRKLTAFPRSNNPISPYTFRFPLWSCQLEQACNLLWCFITYIFTPPHWLAINATSTFLCCHGIDPYIRGFRQLSCKHSNLGYFVDLRPIGSTVHLWTAFTADSSAVRLLSVDFTELPTIYVSVYIAGRSIRAAFQGVTPSFRLSDNQFADCDSSLPFYQRLTFSVRNKSHSSNSL